MKLQLNGKIHNVATGATIGQLLQELNLHPEQVVLELNLTILNTQENLDSPLHEGDKLEIIHFVGGG